MPSSSQSQLRFARAALRLLSSQSQLRSALRLLLGLAALFLLSAPSADAQRLKEYVLYEQPIGAEVVDPFRPPAHIGAPGNRGLEYGNFPGAVVSAAADGFVLFAGPVGGTHAVTIEHWDGLNTTYTGLAELWVEANVQVFQRASLGIANGHLHFGARVNGQYLDPQILLDASRPTVRPRLLPPPD